MNGYTGRQRFTSSANNPNLKLLRAAADKNPRYAIIHISGHTYEWIHYPDANGAGTRDGNDRSDFYRWAGRVLIKTVHTPRSEALESVTITGHGLVVT